MAAGAGEAVVSLVIEFRVGHPLGGGLRGRDHRQHRRSGRDCGHDWDAADGERVALDACFAPE